MNIRRILLQAVAFGWLGLMVGFCPTGVVAQPPSSGTESTPRAKSQIVVDSLDRMTHKTFYTRLQSILVNRCGQSGCHGRNPTGEFQLEVTNYGTPNWPLEHSRKNLQMVLQFVDPANPAESPLLTAIHASHRNLKPPIFRKHENAQFIRLQAEVANLAAGVLRAENRSLSADSGSPPQSHSPSAVQETVIDPFDPAAFNTATDGP